MGLLEEGIYLILFFIEFKLFFSIYRFLGLRNSFASSIFLSLLLPCEVWTVLVNTLPFHKGALYWFYYLTLNIQILISLGSLHRIYLETGIPIFFIRRFPLKTFTNEFWNLPLKTICLFVCPFYLEGLC